MTHNPSLGGDTDESIIESKTGNVPGIIVKDGIHQHGDLSGFYQSK